MHEEWRRNKYGGLFKVTNDYMNKKIREGKQKEIPEENQGINYGDLGKGGDTSYGRMDGSRDTGHFGTGTYFVSPKGYASESYKKRPSNTIDFSEYDNLYKPSNGKEALALHDYLRNINRGVDRLSEDDYWKVWRIRSSEDEDYDYFSNTYKKLKDMNYNPLTYDEYKNDNYYKNYGKGYDNCWLIDDDTVTADGLKVAATLIDRKSGRKLDVLTDQPAAQVYTGNWLAGSPTSKSGRSYNDYDGVAIECQGLPDAPNHPDFPSQLLMPDDDYNRVIFFAFSTCE